MDLPIQERSAELPVPTKKVKMVQIGVVFACETDQEAIAVKAAIDKATENVTGVQIHFGIHDRNP